jgi:hypothetical protein
MAAIGIVLSEVDFKPVLPKFTASRGAEKASTNDVVLKDLVTR